MTTERSPGSCPKCPLAIACAVAKKVIETDPSVHNYAQRSLGGILLTMEILDSVAAEAGCVNADKPDITGSCPNENTVFQARNMAAATWPAGSYDLRLTEIAAAHLEAHGLADNPEWQTNGHVGLYL